MRLYSIYLKLLAIVLTLTLFGCGTHGSLKGYWYDVKKDTLENAVMTVIRNNPNIIRDTNNVNIIIDNSSGVNDTTIDSYYNDGKTYVTIKINVDGGTNEYIFRYYGDEAMWQAASSSQIAICYAYDKDGNGGSEGNGGVSAKLKDKLTKVFEIELIDKIDKELNLRHWDSE
jgi:hypothetical protein